MTQCRDEEVPPLAADGSAGGEDLGGFFEVGVQRCHGAAGEVDELGIAEDVAEHRLGALVVGVELVEGSREPLVRVAIAVAGKLDTLALVSTASDEFRLELPLESASWACREAVAGMDWHLESIQPDRLVLTRSFGFLNMDEARIGVLLSDAGPEATTVTLNGKLSWGIGRWDMRTLTSLMNTVRNAVEVAARRVH